VYGLLLPSYDLEPNEAQQRDRKSLLGVRGKDFLVRRFPSLRIFPKLSLLATICHFFVTSTEKTSSKCIRDSNYHDRRLGPWLDDGVLYFPRVVPQRRLSRSAMQFCRPNVLSWFLRIVVEAARAMPTTRILWLPWFIIVEEQARTIQSFYFDSVRFRLRMIHYRAYYSKADGGEEATSKKLNHEFHRELILWYRSSTRSLRIASAIRSVSCNSKSTSSQSGTEVARSSIFVFKSGNQTEQSFS